ncbi:MAG: MBL fold metallo-hydrolase RNA specificity domain-containing protein [Dehalococcoidia bacterium]|nr:MBL fold metallo-hydrolase RNA specificity domain-containing protein [Dehalococcoidia bacterium]
MLSITGYGGVGEIGGNKVLLEDQDTRLFFDFGFPFKKRARYFDENLNPRPGAGLLDLLEMGLLPPLKGIYREDLAKENLWQKFIPSPQFRKLNVDGVLLTHAHADHSGYISFLKDDIPIYTTIMTAFISKAMQDSTPPNFEREVCYSMPKGTKKGYLRSQGTYKPRPFVFMNCPALSEEAQDFWYSSPTRKTPLGTQPYRCMPEKIGKLKLQAFPVDHSIPGAAAFAVETSAGWVGYTGDLRFHGRACRQTEQFVEEMHRLAPHVLLCEGTRLKEERGATEEEVFENCLKVVNQAKGLVIADFGARNVERLITFYNIAKQTQRKLVIMGKDAYLLDAMHLASERVPSIGYSTDVLIYKDFKSRVSSWEGAIHRRYEDKIITPPYVRENAGDLILCFSFWDSLDLIDIAPPPGGTYIYSASEVFDEEGAMDMRRLANWIDHFGMKAIGLPREELNWAIPENERGYHSSGHACGTDLLDLIRRINPRILVPIHTEDPDYFIRNLKDTGIEIRVPVEGQPLNFP